MRLVETEESDTAEFDERIEDMEEGWDDIDDTRGDGDGPLVDPRPLEQMQQGFEEELRRSYVAWPDTPLPILDGLTPRQAVADADGREMVEALLRHVERMDAPGTSDIGARILARLRDDLGLTTAVNGSSYPG